MQGRITEANLFIFLSFFFFNAFVSVLVKAQGVATTVTEGP